MKRILKFSLVLATVALTTANAHAGNVDFSLDLKKAEGKTVSFTLKEIKEINLAIYDASDILLYQEKVNSDAEVNRTYDLNAFPQGVYFLEAESATKISRYKIEVVGNVAKLSVDAVSEVFKPVFASKNGIVTMNMLNTTKAPVTVQLFNSNDIEMYSKKFTDEMNVGEIFDMSNMQGEKCTFVVTSDGKTFVETVETK